jgi:hypothetical protein
MLLLSVLLGCTGDNPDFGLDTEGKDSRGTDTGSTTRDSASGPDVTTQGTADVTTSTGPATSTTADSTTDPSGSTSDGASTGTPVGPELWAYVVGPYNGNFAASALDAFQGVEDLCQASQASTTCAQDSVVRGVIRTSDEFSLYDFPNAWHYSPVYGPNGQFLESLHEWLVEGGGPLQTLESAGVVEPNNTHGFWSGDFDVGAANCSAWTTVTGTGSIGSFTTTVGWFATTDVGCEGEHYILCLCEPA